MCIRDRDYSVIVSNAAGQAESGIVTVKVVEPIRIVTQPQGSSVNVGDAVTLEVVVEGTEPISYYWYHDGELVESATDSILRIANAQETDSGSYNVIVQNSSATVISEIAELIVLLRPEITRLTYPLTVNKGKSIELGVTATGSEPLTYQWSRDGELIDGATAEILSLVNVTAIDSGNYLSLIHI